MTTPRLDSLIARARTASVRDDHARAYVGELARWARAAEPAPRARWLPWLVGGFAVAAAAVIALVLLRRPSLTREDDLVPLGGRVAIVAEAGTAYHVVVAERDRTTIAVDHGTVTARLWPGEHPHALTLRGGEVEAVATGTVYSLSVDARGAVVAVHEGKVAVTSGGQTHLVARGATWPANRGMHGEAAARRLLATTPPPATDEPPAPPSDAAPAGATDAPVVADTSADATEPAVDKARHPTPDAETADKQPELRDRWRQARLFRGQGRFDDALAECLVIADARDRTWSPIALVEAARIEIGPRAAPERAVELLDRFEREWPTHELAPEARELRCRALRQLGRAGDCGSPP